MLYVYGVDKYVLFQERAKLAGGFIFCRSSRALARDVATQHLVYS
jgi:hypothetical protein